MPITLLEIGIVPSVERFVRTRDLLRHIVVLALLVVLTICTSIVAYLVTLRYGHPTQFSSSDPRVGFRADADGRDTMDIISSCASTLITCVYSSVHFDVPRSLAHRLPLMKKLRSKDFWLELWAKVTFWLLGIFSPEMLVLHAFYEHMIARRDVAWMREHKYPDWSMTLAFAADMGMLVTEDGNRVRSGFWLHERLLRNHEPGAFDCKALEYELADHTKADTLFKILTTVQIIRFLGGTVARAVVKLPIAPLETITCAYVLCTIVYYVLWFPKPYNVNEKIVVQVKPTLQRMSRISQMDVEDPKPEEKPSRVKHFWEKTVLNFIEPPMSEMDREHGSEHMYQESPYMTQGSLIAAAASLFVGFAHIFCWDVEFPNSNGQILWRWCSLLIIVLPIFVFIIILGAALMDSAWVTWWMNKMALTAITVYCIARLVLLTLLGHSFQSLPVGVYDTRDISWLSFVPFIH